MENKHISKTIKVFYGVGDLGFTLMTNLSTYLLTYFQTNVAHFSLAAITIWNTINSTIMTVTSPIYGAIMSGGKAGKHGRYRSWLLKLWPLILIVNPAKWLICDPSILNNTTIAVALSLLFTTIATQAFNFSYVANASLIAVVAKTPEDKASMSATRGMWTNSSKLIWGVVGTPFVTLVTLWLGGHEAWAYTVVQAVFTSLMILGYFAHFKMTEGYEPIEVETKEVKAKDKVSFGDMMKALVQNPHLLTMLIVDLLRWTVQFTMMGAAIYFFKYSLNNLALQATYLTVANFMAIAGSYIMKPMVAKFGTRTTGLIAFAGMAVCLIVGRLIYTIVIPVMALLILAQLFLGIAYTSIPTLYADAVIFSEWKMGKNAAGFIMGLMNVPLKASSFIKTFITTGILAASNYNADIDPATATTALKDGLANLFIGVPGYIMAAAVIIYLLGYKLTPAKVQQCKDEIAQRNANA